MLEMALARIRQLSAHEVGHTLGLAHNFAASVNNRASVMDYPAPLVTLAGDSVSIDRAYDTGIGEWDKMAIRYGYTEPSEGQSEADLLEDVIQAAQDAGLWYITDRDARPAGAAHPKANLWENGDDMVQALEREMDVRRIALDRFDARTIRTGEPMAVTEEVLVPLYLRHRYQVEATTKLVGGVTYNYAIRGDDDAMHPERVDASRQEAALDALLATITPDALAVPAIVREHLPPRPPGYPSNRELFPGRTGLTFDAYAPAEVAASMVLEGVVHPERAMRLVAQHDADASLPSLRSVLTDVTDRVWKADPPRDAYEAELQRTVQQVWTDVLLERAADTDVAPAVQARVTQHLRGLSAWLGDNPGADAETQAHRRHVRDAIERYLQRSQDADAPPAELDTPPGSPIGQGPAWHVRQQRRDTWRKQWMRDPLRCERR